MSLECFFNLKEKTFKDVKRERESTLLKKNRNTMSKITSDHCITSSAVLEQMIKHAGNQKRKYPEANHDKPSGSGYKKMKSQKVLTKL